MVKTADLRKGDYPPFPRRVDASRRGRVLPQGEMRSVIVAEIRTKKPPEMCTADNDHVIEALAADGSDQSLRIRILPGAGRGADDFGNTHAGYTAPEHLAVDGV